MPDASARAHQSCSWAGSCSRGCARAFPDGIQFQAHVVHGFKGQRCDRTIHGKFAIAPLQSLPAHVATLFRRLQQPFPTGLFGAIAAILRPILFKDFAYCHHIVTIGDHGLQSVDINQALVL